MSSEHVVLKATHLFRGDFLVAEYMPGVFVGGGAIMFGWRFGYDQFTPVASGQVVTTSPDVLECANLDMREHAPFMFKDRWELWMPAPLNYLDWDALPVDERPVPAEVSTVDQARAQ